MMIMRLLIMFLMLQSMTACAPGLGDCNLHVVTTMPLAVREKLLLVPAKIDGKWVTLIVGTGADRTSISEESVARLGLSQGEATHTARGVGGSFTTRDVIIPDLELGGVRLSVERLATGKFRFGQGLAADGLLGNDILGAFDLDLNVPGRTLTLYKTRRCPGVRPPWVSSAAEVAGIGKQKDRLQIPLVLDGVEGMGIFDTGSVSTVVGPAMATRLGLTRQELMTDPIIRHFGAGPNVLEARLHRFNLLTVGRVTVRRPSLSVLPEEIGTGDALVGEDFISNRRFWISFLNQEMFIAEPEETVPAPLLAPPPTPTSTAIPQNRTYTLVFHGESPWPSCGCPDQSRSMETLY